MMDSVAALLVNAAPDFEKTFDSEHASVFGSPVALSKYDRPFIDGHPRLIPEPRPCFQIVIIDLEVWIAGRTGLDILLGPPLPQWVTDAIAGAARFACVVVLCPNRDAAQGVQKRVDHIPGSNRPFVISADFGASKTPPVSVTKIVERLWTAWGADRTVGAQLSTIELIFRR